MQIETKVIKKSTYDLSKIKNNQFVLHHHLGLGDHIICNGLVNYISRDFELIYLPVKEKNFKNIEYLYKENSVISLFQIEDEEMDIKKFSKAHNLQILKIGFKLLLYFAYSVSPFMWWLQLTTKFILIV